MYWNGGISPSFTISWTAAAGRLFQSEKLRRERPPSTSRCTSQENGAMLVAHHHLVSLLWQS